MWDTCDLNLSLKTPSISYVSSPNSLIQSSIFIFIIIYIEGSQSLPYLKYFDIWGEIYLDDAFQHFTDLSTSPEPLSSVFFNHSTYKREEESPGTPTHLFSCLNSYQHCFICVPTNFSHDPNYWELLQIQLFLNEMIPFLKVK